MIGSVLRVRYELTQQIVENPVFEVFAAQDKVQGREVCVRLLRGQFAKDQDFVETLTQVVKRVAAFHHPNIEELFEVDSDDDAVFVVGQLTKGSSLAERLRKLATFSVPGAVETGIAVCEGLQNLHRSAIAHGDLSGRTIMMQSDGEIRLQTPGFWEAYYTNSSARDSMLALNAAYIAPEVSRGSLPSPSSDVYAVGVILYELLTGRQPYRGETPVAIAVQHATEPVPSPKALNPSVPLALDGIVKKALAKSVDERYRDAGELLSDLRMLQDALRFGKSMPWPPRPIAEPVLGEAAASTPRPAVPAPAAAAAAPRKRVKTTDDADVPVWIRIAIAFFSGLLFVIIVFFMFANFQRPTTVKVPELKRMNETLAGQTLSKLGLRIGTRKEQPSEQVPAGNILSTEPPAGTPMYPDNPVNVVVSTGSKFVEVPDLRGVTADKAKEVLASVGLVLDEDHIEDVPDRNLDKGLIVSQTPPPRGKYERNTRVRVKVSSGGSRVSSSGGDANTKYLYTIKITLSDVDQPVLLKVDLTDSRGTKTLREEEHSPGDQVQITAEGYGSEVYFRIFYNGELVKEVPAKAGSSDNTETNPA